MPAEPGRADISVACVEVRVSGLGSDNEGKAAIGAHCPDGDGEGREPETRDEAPFKPPRHAQATTTRGAATRIG